MKGRIEQQIRNTLNHKSAGTRSKGLLTNMREMEGREKTEEATLV